MAVFEVVSGGDRRSLILRFERKSKQQAISELVDFHLLSCTRIEKLEQEVAELRARVVVVPERMEFPPMPIHPCVEDHEACGEVHGFNACLDELARLNGKVVSEGLLRKWLELMEHGDFREGHCMCGSAVDSHGIVDGHAPVDAGEYYAGQVMEELRDLLGEGKEVGDVLVRE